MYFKQSFLLNKSCHFLHCSFGNVLKHCDSINVSHYLTTRRQEKETKK